MRLIFTRHPITKENKIGIIQGKDVGTVDEEGFKQIKKLITRLKKEKIDIIISSDAKRCVSMTNEILKEIPVPYEFTNLIDEKSYGEYVGKNSCDVNKSDLQGDNLEIRKYPGGENLLDLKERAKKFLNSIDCYKNSDKTILIISHSIFLSVLIAVILNMNIVDARYKFEISHCSLSIVETTKNKEYILKNLNETSFLS
jgi:broad specificity phosphatase PhoE